MTSSSFEKQIRQQAKDIKKADRDRKVEQQAINAMGEWRLVHNVRIMDPDAEAMLAAVLKQYDDNDENTIWLDTRGIAKHLANSRVHQCEKLKQGGLLTGYFVYDSDTIRVMLSASGKTYFERKEAALKKEREENTRRERIETDYLRIQAMTLDELRNVYLQVVSANDTLNKTLDTQKSQLEVQERQLSTLKNLFVSGEDGVTVQKEIMRQLKVNKSNDIRDFLADKGADFIVAGILEAMKLVLQAQGVLPT